MAVKFSFSLQMNIIIIKPLFLLLLQKIRFPKMDKLELEIKTLKPTFLKCK